MYYNRLFTVIWVFTYLQAYVSFLIHLDGILLHIIVHHVSTAARRRWGETSGEERGQGYLRFGFLGDRT